MPLFGAISWYVTCIYCLRRTYMQNEKMNLSLTQKVMECQKSGEGFDALCQELAIRAYQYPKRKYNCDTDLCSDFLVFVYPSIGKAVGNYQHKGLTFEHYYHTMLCLQLRSYFRKQKEARLKWESGIDENLWDVPEYNVETEPADFHFDLKKVFKFNAQNLMLREYEKRQLLFYALKKCWSMTEQNIRYLAEVTGYDAQWIGMLVENLKHTLANRERRFRIAQIRKNKAYAQLLLHEKLLRSEYDANKQACIRIKIEKIRLTYNRACKSIATVPLMPTQGAIAVATGFPKGTVDAAIYSFKKKVIRVSLN